MSYPELEAKLSKAKSLLILDHPFFGTAVSRRPIKFRDDIPTAAMSARGQMYINPTFLEGLNTKQVMFLLAHEAMHYMFAHSLRKGHRIMQPWNVACDKVINDTLTDAKVGEFIEGGIQMRDARNYAAEELYDEQDNGGSGGDIGGCGGDIMEPVDEDTGKPLDESEKHQIEAQAKIETLQSAKAAKAVGKLPSNLERMVDALVNVKTPWHDILERFMHGRTKDDYNWHRPNRRFMGRGMYLPGTDYVPKMGNVVIAVDTSGSIGQPEINEFNGHINRILDTCNPEKVIVLYCDAQLNGDPVEYTKDDFPVRLECRGGGGTAFNPVFDWIENECQDEIECCVYLTDGYGNQNSFDTHIETVWLTTGSTQFNWGTVVEFESEAA